TGTVTVTLATMTVTDGTVTMPDAGVVSIDVEDADVFAGTGGALLADHTGINRPLILSQGVGFLADNVDFKMVLASGAAADLDVNVTKLLDDQSEVAIAVNPNDPNNIIVAPIDGNAQTGVFGTISSN